MTAAALAAGGALAVGLPTSAQATVQTTHHAVNVCQTATFYYGFNPGIHGTAGNANYVLEYGNKIGWQDASPIINGWAVVIDYTANGANDRWGWLRQECIGGIDSW